MTYPGKDGEIIFATTPDGVSVISAKGAHLGTISGVSEVFTDVEYGLDSYLYMTTTYSVMRVALM